MSAKKFEQLKHDFALFDGRGEWYDHENVQVATGWKEAWQTGDSPLGDGQPWNRLVAPEGRYMTTLPAQEKEAFLNDVTRETTTGFTYHIFGGGPWWDRQWQEIELEPGRYEIELWLHGDWATGGQFASKTADGLEARHALAELFIGDEGKKAWLEMNLVGDNRLTRLFEIDSRGTFEVGWGIYTVWANTHGPNGCFIKGFTLSKVEEVAQQPLQTAPTPKKPAEKPQPPKEPTPTTSGGVSAATIEALLSKVAELETLIRDLAEADLSETEAGAPVAAASAPPMAAEAVERAIVIDISHHQAPHTFPFKRLKEEGVVGVYVRLSNGLKKDNASEAHLSWARAAGLLVGGYHFLDRRNDIDEQFGVFQRGLQGGKFDLPPAVDVEEVHINDFHLPLPSEAQLRRFTDLCKQIHPRPVIYSSRHYINQVGSHDFGCDLWLAAYTNREPLLPNGWQDDRWTFWQFTTDPNFKCYPYRLDTNRFNGSRADLMAYAGRDENVNDEAFNLLAYMAGDGSQYEVRHNDGSTTLFQTQQDGGRYYQLKNEEWQEFWVADGAIYRGVDTSMGGGRYYKMTTEGAYGAPWIRRKMNVGEKFTRSAEVTVYNKDGTPVSGPSPVTDTMTFVRHHPRWKGADGFQVKDVIELAWHGGESYFYARGLGLVGWGRTHEDPDKPQSSAISRLVDHGEQTTLVRETVTVG